MCEQNVNEDKQYLWNIKYHFVKIKICQRIAKLFDYAQNDCGRYTICNGMIYKKQEQLKNYTIILKNKKPFFFLICAGVPRILAGLAMLDISWELMFHMLYIKMFICYIVNNIDN